MPRLLSAFVIAVLFALSAAQAMATSFGRMTNASLLGQRLDFSVPMRLDAGEDLAPGCLTAEVQSGEFRLSANVVKVVVEPGNDTGERLIRVATHTPIDEPVVTVTVQAGCTNPLTRKFVAFVDPPVINLARAATPRLGAADSAPVAALPAARAEVTVATPAAAPRTDVAEAPAAPASAKRKRGVKAPGGAPASATASRTAKASGSARSTRNTLPTRVAAAAPAVKGPRLSLDAPAPEVILTQTVLRLSDSLPAVLPPAASSPHEGASAPAGANVEAEAQRAKLAALDASFDKLRAESQATQASLLLLQAQLRDSQSARYSNPLTYALIALVALLGAALVFLLKQRAAARREAPQWWAPPTGADVASIAAVSSEARAATGPVAVRPELWDEPETDPGETTASPRLLAPAETSPPAVAPLDAEREMSVEELIDLEQQAEFFVILGQDEAAIDLLMGHMRSSGGTSPLPYLKLLEIYRRLDDHEAYERTREKFNRRFNAYAPDWESDLQKGRALEEYSHVIAKLQSLWNAPTQTMQALERSLFRRDSGAPNFDLPAYRELLFLYSVARDLSEHGAERAASAKVDVLLPIDAQTSVTGTFTRLNPTRPMPIAPDAYTTQVDVDITTLDADGRSSRPQNDFNTTPGFIGLVSEKTTGSR